MNKHIKLKLYDEFPEDPDFRVCGRSGLYAVVVVVGADAHLAFYLPFTYFLSPHPWCRTVNLLPDWPSQPSFVLHLLLPRPLFHYKC